MHFGDLEKLGETREHPFSCYESASPWCARRGVGCRSAAEAATPAVGGRGRGATAGRRPWPTLTCDADRYGDACRDCHVCAVHERKRPSRMREWQWAETVNRTEKGGATRAPFGKTRPFDKTRPGRRARPEPDMGISDLIGSISELRSGIPGPGAAPGVFIIQQCAARGVGVVCEDVLLRCTAVVLLRRVRGNNFK